MIRRDGSPHTTRSGHPHEAPVLVTTALVIAALGCGSQQPAPQPTEPPPTTTAPPTGSIDAGAIDTVPADAAPIASIDVVRASGRGDGTVFHMRPAPGLPCQTWSLRADPSDASRGRLIHPGDPKLSFAYRVTDNGLVLRGPHPGTGDQADEGVLGALCNETLDATGDDHDAIDLGGGRWFFDAAGCEAASALAPRSCLAAVATAIARVDRSRNLFDYVVKKRGPITRLRQDDDGLHCEDWRFGRKRLTRTGNDGDGMFYEYEYDGTSLTLSGPNYDGDAGTIAIGSFAQYPIIVISDEVVLVGAEPWFLRDATCDRAAAAASAAGG